MLRWWLICFIVCFLILNCTRAQYASKCELPDQQTGMCMPVNSCKPALEFFSKIHASGKDISPSERQHFLNLHCGTFKNVPHVCCSETDVQLNVDGMKMLLNQDCGEFIVDKISNGHEAPISGYPWMALLVYNDTRQPYRCAGSMITSKYVLTAAHCIKKDLYQVRLGEHRISTNPDCKSENKGCAPPMINVDIEDIIVPENFRKFYHDISLIRLKREILPQSNIKPVCLPIYDDLRAKEHPKYVITGWGRTDKASISDVLMFAHVPVVERSECQTLMTKYSLRLPLTYGQFCAGNRDLIDTCDGDSGGPIGFKDMYDDLPRFVQYGVVSFGVNFCGEGNAPNVYTNVSQYLQWITDHLRK